MNNLLKAAALALVLALGSMGGVVWASESSQPGSPLYPIKMTIERIRLAVDQAMTADEITEPGLQLELADDAVDDAVDDDANDDSDADADTNAESDDNADDSDGDDFDTDVNDNHDDDDSDDTDDADDDDDD